MKRSKSIEDLVLDYIVTDEQPTYSPTAERDLIKYFTAADDFTISEVVGALKHWEAQGAIRQKMVKGKKHWELVPGP